MNSQQPKSLSSIIEECRKYSDTADMYIFDSKVIYTDMAIELIIKAFKAGAKLLKEDLDVQLKSEAIHSPKVEESLDEVEDGNTKLTFKEILEKYDLEDPYSYEY